MKKRSRERGVSQRRPKGTRRNARESLDVEVGVLLGRVDGVALEDEFRCSRHDVCFVCGVRERESGEKKKRKEVAVARPFEVD